MTLLNGVELALWITLGVLFWKKKLHDRFPMMGKYLGLRMASMPILLVLFHGQAQHWFHNYCFDIYFFFYWAVYIVSAVLLFFVSIEVFRSALSEFSGLQKLGTVIFRWAALISAVLSLSTVQLEHPKIILLPMIALRLMRSVSILELCLLGFLCLSFNALRLSVRDMAFGIALGLGLMSANDFIESLVISIHTSMTASWQFAYESVILSTLCMWVTYCALPEPVRKPVLMPIDSFILRWNEIASALGHTGTQVAMQRPARGFVLSEVEKAVESTLTRKLEGRESES